MVPKHEECGEVFYNKQVAQGIYQMSVHAPRIAASALSGQFVQACVASEPSIQFLRMPFAVFDVNEENGSVDICYQVVGDGTEQLSQVKAGQMVSLVGPIGNGWNPPHDIKRALLACGGVGAPALKMLADKLAADGACVDAVIGSTTGARLACVPEFEVCVQEAAGKVHIATDDGSVGTRGFVNAVTNALLEAHDYDYVAVCGPPMMERSVVLPALEKGIFTEVSMEKLMACGIGACLGCVVETTHGLKRCCVDGPVFDGNEVIW